MAIDLLKATIRSRQLMKDEHGRVLRQRAGLSLRQAAKIAGVSPSTLTRWERGLATPVRGGAAVRWAKLADRIEELLTAAGPELSNQKEKGSGRQPRALLSNTTNPTSPIVPARECPAGTSDDVAG